MSSQHLPRTDIDWDGPALQPPPHVTPDFEHPWNLNTIALVTNTLCLAVTIAACSIRAYAKLCIRRIELEDFLMLLALGAYLAAVWCGYQIIGTTGSFTHQWNVRLKDLGPNLYIQHLVFNFNVVALGLTKAAILIEWTRIFVPRGIRNLFYWVSGTLLLFVFLTHIAIIVTENLSCMPYEKIWNVTITSGSCIAEKVYHLPGNVIDLASTLIILILAQRAIWNLQMSLNNKIGISLIFFVGVLALASSIARAVAASKYFGSNDRTHTTSAYYLWSLAELTCSFLAFCAPTAPQAYTNRHAIVEFVAYLMTRVGISRAKARLWPSPGPSSIGVENWDLSKGYRRIRGRTSASPLASYQTSGGAGRGPVEPLPHDAILVTTSFTAEVTGLAEARNDREQSTEYPWNHEL
ncbi:hypothetical protein F4803DRAFT_557137 [Xylaria telfairii]|nr:hypothetical protein F4803DRAFT_557137 [Xylaria telfairii]